MNNKKTDSILIDGIVSSLIAFLIAIGICFVLSLVFNLTGYKEFNQIMSGNLGGDKGASVNSILRITVILFNFSLFNTVGTVRFGILIFAFIPIIAFWLANRQLNKKGNLGPTNISIYLISSLIFASLQFIISLITKGELVEGLPINFATLSNFIATFILTFIIQLFIKLNYRNTGKNAGIKAFKSTYRIMGIVAGFIGIVAIVAGVSSQSNNIIMMIIAVIAMLPNVISYIFFYMIGLTMKFNDVFQEQLNIYINLDLTFQNRMYIRYIAILLFVLIIAYVIYKMDKKKFIRNAIIYSLTLGIFMGTLGYCSSINFIEIKYIGSIQFGVSSILLSVFIPILVIWIVILLYYLIKRIKDIIRE
ncbi:hypothetical protein SH1V18_10750 [Vallitalea longa]|uniref:Uncharacterized protein n=1 Tax=Vallitalea longa TaxID=2936439 RepID=A0A9W5Y9N0_9FIRM|nr:hypothetical protein [Vallitalea longa]GKX28595.1 hypothetical protein SH1V18_10750 [Vallitalea longa]